MLFYFMGAAPTEIYTLSLHDALPISLLERFVDVLTRDVPRRQQPEEEAGEDRDQEREQQHAAIECEILQPEDWQAGRSEEHTSELQSQSNLVCRLLLEKKKPYEIGSG